LLRTGEIFCPKRHHPNPSELLGDVICTKKKKRSSAQRIDLSIELVNHPPKSRTQILKELYFYCKKTREREREREEKKKKKGVILVELL
jgi:hypothetical protein